MERKKTRLNESEMKVMQIIWNAGHPITGQQVLGQITEQYKGSWHPRTIYPLMRKLSEKGMIRDVGSARVGKVYARQFLPAISRPEYMALRIIEDHGNTAGSRTSAVSQLLFLLSDNSYNSFSRQQCRDFLLAFQRLYPQALFLYK